MNAAEHREKAERNLSNAQGHCESLQAAEFPDRAELGLIRSNMAVAHALLALAATQQEHPGETGGRAWLR